MAEQEAARVGNGDACGDIGDGAVVALNQSPLRSAFHDPSVFSWSRNAMRTMCSRCVSSFGTLWRSSKSGQTFCGAGCCPSASAAGALHESVGVLQRFHGQLAMQVREFLAFGQRLHQVNANDRLLVLRGGLDRLVIEVVGSLQDPECVGRGEGALSVA